MQTARAAPLDSHLLPLRNVVYVHPVQEIEANHDAQQERLRKFALANTYGDHMVLRMEMDKQMLSTFQRLPVLKSSFAGLQALTGDDLEFNTADSFPDFFESPKFMGELHVLTEQKLKL